MRKKKFQIFISSTYLDLQDERQAAVEAILGSKHIPAGMELFRAGNKSQLETIKKWIDESDLYMLILGGRYGSIEPITEKSYTQLEYEYAIERGLPVFAVILNDSFLHKKASGGLYEVFEKYNVEKYNEFKSFVKTKVIKLVDDCKDIQIAIKDSISELESEYNLTGWIRASEVVDNSKILAENIQLIKENDKLKNDIKKKEKNMILGFTYKEIISILENKEIIFPKELFSDGKEERFDYLDIFKKFKNRYSLGVDVNSLTRNNKKIVKLVSPFLMNIGLLEIKYNKIILTKEGRHLASKIDVDEVKKKEKRVHLEI